ncbi:MAG: HAD hydrolase-like protein [Eubacteriales bacterium]|nr:HAD hydrolase-like protein [Eubacteriales bacterium]
MTKKYILFDLDGTLTDSSEGITKSVQHALNKLGIKENDQAMLRRFIGPPLDESFEKFYGLDKETALKAVDYYRERYSDKGIYENVLFDGIDALLAALKEDGYIVALATCKPEIYVPRILEYFNVGRYFDVAVGSELEGGERRHKNQVIDEVFVRLSKAGLLENDDITTAKSKAIMIGDRKDDILGAKASGIESMGVRYGFAEEQELEIAGADYIVETVEDIRKKLKTL